MNIENANENARTRKKGNLSYFLCFSSTCVFICFTCAHLPTHTHMQTQTQTRRKQVKRDLSAKFKTRTKYACVQCNPCACVCITITCEQRSSLCLYFRHTCKPGFRCFLQSNRMFFSAQLCKLPPQCWYFDWQFALRNLQPARTTCSRKLQICSCRFLGRFLFKLKISLGTLLS